MNIKKPLFLALSITVIFASTLEDENNVTRVRNVVNPWLLDAAYVSDNPVLYKFSQQMFHNFFNWYSPNSNAAAWQLPNLSLYFPWMNQTQKYKHP